MNRNGKNIIDFCKMSDMKVLNGRLGNNKSLGNVHCPISCKKTYKKDTNVNINDHSQYCIKNHAKIKWNQELC